LAGAFFLVTLRSTGAAPPDRRATKNTLPRIEDYATIEAYVGKEEVPVYAFGYTYVYGVSPELLPGAVMQEGDRNPVLKLKPKKSWEIHDNLCGSAWPREPKTMWNDDQPLLPIHLIDGDPETAWSSRSNGRPDRNPEWIRVDLPMESTVASVALVCSKIGPCINGSIKAGKALPKEIVIKLSRDAREWETVYENRDFSGPSAGATVIEFKPRPAKQVWIIANKLPNMGFWGYGFSIGEVEVRDPGGKNLALLSRGAGVQVSSTYYGFGMDRFTQDMLWPIQYDLGFKWTRVGYDMGTFLWSYVEREQGKLEIDARTDEAITDACRNGVKIIMCLDKGNWLYRSPPRKADWKKARVREMMDTYWDHQGWPTDSPALLAGYLRYVDYMVRRFKGRVAYYELCNEWQGIGIDNYVKLLKAAIPAIRKADPEAKIMLGSTSGLDRPAILACLGKEPGTGIRGGKFCVEGPAELLAVVRNVQAKDVVARVDARGDGDAGIILRFKDGANFLLANYAPQLGTMYFHERVAGQWGPFLDAVSVAGLGPNIRLTVGVEGAQATFSVSDGTKTLSTRHTIRRLLDSGSVGLFHTETPVQAFDNFRAAGPGGKAIFEDAFGAAENSLPAGWQISGGCLYSAVEKGLGTQLDAIGWHPWYGVDPDNPAYRSYRKDVEQFRNDCAKLGFKGQFAATEWWWAGPYPPHAEFPWCSEMQKAKYSAQLMTAHAGMDVISLYCESHQNSHDIDDSLLRNGFQHDPISPAQPEAIYYVLRSISTVLDGFKAAPIEVRFTADRQLDCYTFRRGKDELMVAAWLPGKTKDGLVESRSDILLPGVQIREAWVMDVLNGTEQKLNVIPKAGGAVFKGILIKDYPVFVRARISPARFR
jgi:hypothetical protein